jgi:inorganic pyrophosphatase
MRMIDKGEMDDKIIAVASNDVSVNYIQNFDDLPPHLLLEIKRFFEDYKKLEQKSPVIVDQFLGKKKALAIIKESLVSYKKHFSKGVAT